MWRVDRSTKVQVAGRLRSEGLLLREIAAEMGVSVSSAHEYLTDPTRSKVRERKAKYLAACTDCGGAASSGSLRCRRCLHSLQKASRVPEDERRAKNSARERARYRAIRKEALEAYGGKCRACGTADDLRLHHVAGGGTEHRLELAGNKGGGTSFLYRLKREGWPDDPPLELLCHGCHVKEHRKMREGVRRPPQTCRVMMNPAEGAAHG